MKQMDVDDSRSGYRLLSAEGKRFQYSVFELRKSPLRVAAVCLGLLGVVLLGVIIGQQVHYHKVERDHQNSYNALTKERDDLQDNLKTTVKDKHELDVSRGRIQDSFNRLSKRTDQLQTNNNKLSSDVDNLRRTQIGLQTRNTALTMERDQLKTQHDQVQSNIDALSNARDLSETRYKAMVQQKRQIQADYNSAVKDKNEQVNKYNNLTRAFEQLQLSYSTVSEQIEQLQDSLNASAGEKDATEELKKSHSNTTKERDILKASYILLVNVTEQLHASIKALSQERDQLEVNYKNLTADRDWLKTRFDNLTAEREELQGEIERLKETKSNKTCPFGWLKFQKSCYYTSSGKKDWKQSRQDCQQKGADLAIINTQEEMSFISDLYASDEDAWIGLTDGGVEGKWKWVDGTPLTTAYWATGQPNSFNGKNQDCVEVWHRQSEKGKWNDENCNLSQRWICEV